MPLSDFRVANADGVRRRRLESVGLRDRRDDLEMFGSYAPQIGAEPRTE